MARKRKPTVDELADNLLDQQAQLERDLGRVAAGLAVSSDSLTAWQIANGTPSVPIRKEFTDRVKRYEDVRTVALDALAAMTGDVMASLLAAVQNGEPWAIQLYFNQLVGAPPKLIEQKTEETRHSFTANMDLSPDVAARLAEMFSMPRIDGAEVIAGKAGDGSTVVEGSATVLPGSRQAMGALPLPPELTGEDRGEEGSGLQT